MQKKGVYIKTYGCQMNVYDSERIYDLLSTIGYQKVDSPEEAEVAILNTCHIREKATEKVYSELGILSRIKRQCISKGGKYFIVVIGCVGQAEGEAIFIRSQLVDIVLGSQSYYKLPDVIKDLASTNAKTQFIDLDFSPEEKFDNLQMDRTCNTPSAFISIQEGCDKFCKFCVVPYTRGAEYSRPVEQILSEVQQVITQGVVEIYLLGQNVNAYHGIDKQGNVCSLGKLISLVCKFDDVKRVRYTTSHPINMHDELFEAHATEEKLMPFIHLPIQSGSNIILQAMNRKHDVEYYYNIIEKLRCARPDIAFSSDFIVGFPEETEEDFENTLELIRKVKYAQCFSFKYSPRPGTVGSEMNNQVDEEVKKDRLQRIQDLLKKQQLEFHKSMVNKEFEILIEKEGRYKNQIIGKSPYLQSVCVDYDSSNKENISHLKKVRIIDYGQNHLSGEIL